MTADGFWGETWQPGNRLGFATSVVSALFLAIFFWWFGIMDTGATIDTVSATEFVGALLVSLILGGGALMIHEKPVWRERWRTSMRLRAVVSLPIVGVVAILLVFSPPVLSISFVVMAVVFIPGRTYLYLVA